VKGSNGRSAIPCLVRFAGPFLVAPCAWVAEARKSGSNAAVEVTIKAQLQYGHELAPILVNTALFLLTRYLEE
jgi:hypothetical protein